MEIKRICISYFRGFSEIANCKKNRCCLNALALAKILSYFTVIIPLAFAITLGIAYLHGRCFPSPSQKNAAQQAEQLSKKLQDADFYGLLGNTATFVNNLRAALECYAQSGNLDSQFKLESNLDATPRDMFEGFYLSDYFPPLVATIRAMNNPNGQKLATQLEAIKEWATRLNK